MTKVDLIFGILFIVLAVIVLLGGCEGNFYTTPNPRVEDVRNCDYPEPESLYLRERYRHEHIRSKRD